MFKHRVSNTKRVGRARAPTRRLTPLRPRSHTTLGHAPSQADTAPEMPRPLPAVALYVRRARGGPSAAMPVRAPWYGGIFTVTATSRPCALFKHRRSPPRVTRAADPPSPPPSVSSPLRLLPPPAKPS
jgi:hypothetical protein